MNTFLDYVDKLESLALKEDFFEILKKDRRSIASALNGEVSRIVRSVFTSNECRKNGTFFTGENLSQKATHRFINSLNTKIVVADPACGAGNLLLACASKLTVYPSLQKTLELWSKQLMGFDINQDFVKAAKLRLILLAKLRTKEHSPITEFDSYFPMIQMRNFFDKPDNVCNATHIILNPPYNKMASPTNCKWASGTINAASLFLDLCLKFSKNETKISAILPDVLRSGSIYKRWRDNVSSQCDITRIKTHGQFDKFTDVDVFTLRAQRSTVKKVSFFKPWHLVSHSSKISDHFSVHVGPVVPHRHPEMGPLLSYIDARTAKPWSVIKRIRHKRKFQGTVFTPPFVVIRRTSRPGSSRAIGSIVVGKRNVAIENHLLVLLPKSKEETACVFLVQYLKTKSVDDWFDQRICCRHLTVEAIKDLPLSLGVEVNG